jgi:HAD superfamily phosphatase (TIGR01668 family)
MLEKFIPDIYQKSIYAIDYKKLKLRGIKCIIFDVDNTLAPITTMKPSRKVKDLVERLKDLGFRVVLMSNASKKRLTPFKDILEVDCSASSKKPFPWKFNRIMKKYNYKVDEVAIIGDQLVTDVFGGNRVGITTILVNPIGSRDRFFTRITRIIERIVIRKAMKKKLFAKGQYYE